MKEILKINKDFIDFRIKPYKQEAGVQIVIDAIIIIFVFVGLTSVGSPIYVQICISAVYISLEILLYYITLIRAITDRNKGELITERVRINKFRDDGAIAKNRVGESPLRFFYPKDASVERLKIEVIDELGEKKKLRTVMSFRRWLILATLERSYQIEWIDITYLKRSKIMIWVDIPESEYKKSSKKMQRRLEKEYRFINKLV
jgi:hypothetical protein